MILKHLLLVWLLAAFVSVCNSCGGKGGNGGAGGDGGGKCGDGGKGGDGGAGRKRTAVGKGRLFALTFQTFDNDGDGLITLEEFLNVQPGRERLFHLADADKNGVVTCPEFSREVSQFGGKPIC